MYNGSIINAVTLDPATLHVQPLRKRPEDAAKAIPSHAHVWITS